MRLPGRTFEDPLLRFGAAALALALLFAAAVAAYALLRTGDQPVAANKKFRGIITTGAKDLAGNPLATDFVWTFTTRSA